VVPGINQVNVDIRGFRGFYSNGTRPQTLPATPPIYASGDGLAGIVGG
jgi:hypothetical protein